MVVFRSVWAEICPELVGTLFADSESGTPEAEQNKAELLLEALAKSPDCSNVSIDVFVGGISLGYDEASKEQTLVVRGMWDDVQKVFNVLSTWGAGLSPVVPTLTDGGTLTIDCANNLAEILVQEVNQDEIEPPVDLNQVKQEVEEQVAVSADLDSVSNSNTLQTQGTPETDHCDIANPVNASPTENNKPAPRETPQKRKYSLHSVKIEPANDMSPAEKPQTRSTRRNKGNKDDAGGVTVKNTEGTVSPQGNTNDTPDERAVGSMTAALPDYVKSKKGIYLCAECPYKNKSRRYVNQHVRRHHLDKSVICKTCGKPFGMLKDLKQHMIRHDDNRPMFTCKLCSKSFKIFQSLRGHMKNVHHSTEEEMNEVLKPPERTSKEPISVVDENIFSEIASEQDGVYHCKTCEYTSETKRNMRLHIRRLHMDKVFKCDRCDKSFGMQKDWRHHMKTHEDGCTFSCQDCHKCFKSKQALRIHQDTKHKNLPNPYPVKPVPCKLCGKMCRSKYDLRSHMNVRHLFLRPFVCHTCGKSFPDKNYLKQHERVHSENEPYQCDLCGKTFKMLASLRIHHTVHLEENERPHECNVCSKKFTQVSALRRHKRIHTGDRPYICELCGANFSDSSILRRHKQGMHKMGKQPASSRKRKPVAEPATTIKTEIPEESIVEVATLTEAELQEALVHLPAALTNPPTMLQVGDAEGTVTYEIIIQNVVE